MIYVKDKDTGEQICFKNIKSVLKNINRDRNSEWIRYNKYDWKEGLQEFTEYELIKVNKSRITKRIRNILKFFNIQYKD